MCKTGNPTKAAGNLLEQPAVASKITKCNGGNKLTRTYYFRKDSDLKDQDELSFKQYVAGEQYDQKTLLENKWMGKLKIEQVLGGTEETN